MISFNGRSKRPENRLNGIIKTRPPLGSVLKESQLITNVNLYKGVEK